jgi:hypothetical protein
MNKGKDYKFDDILQFALDNDYTVKEINTGEEEIGKDFVVLEHNEKDETISFVLSGATGHEFIYECVYNSKEVPTLP